MSNNNNEHRELTAAELDLVGGAAPIYMHYVDGVIGKPGVTGPVQSFTIDIGTTERLDL